MIIYFNDLKVEVPEDFFKGTGIEYVVQMTLDQGDIPRINIDGVSVTKNNVEMVLKYILSLEKGMPILRQSTNVLRDVEIADYIGFKKATKILALAGIKQGVKGYEHLIDHLDFETVRSMIHVSYEIYVDTEVKNNKVLISGISGNAIKVVIDFLNIFSKTSDPEYYYSILYEIIDKCFFTTDDGDSVNVKSSVSQKLKFMFLECDNSEFEHCNKSFLVPMTELYKYCKEVDEQDDMLKESIIESLISEGAKTVKVHALSSKPFIIREDEKALKVEDFPIFYDTIELEYENGAYKKLNSVGIPILVR